MTGYRPAASQNDSVGPLKSRGRPQGEDRRQGTCLAALCRGGYQESVDSEMRWKRTAPPTS